MTDRELDDGSMNRAATRGADPDGDGVPGAASPELLPELRQHDVGAHTATRIRSRALAALQRRELAAQPGFARVWLWYERAIEPTLWLGLGLGYCVWAAAGAIAILR